MSHPVAVAGNQVSVSSVQTLPFSFSFQLSIIPVLPLLLHLSPTHLSYCLSTFSSTFGANTTARTTPAISRPPSVMSSSHSHTMPYSLLKILLHFFSDLDLSSLKPVHSLFIQSTTYTTVHTAHRRLRRNNPRSHLTNIRQQCWRMCDDDDQSGNRK